MSKRKRDDLDSWLEEEYRKDPGMEARVDALVAEMALEQDLVSLRERAGVSQRRLAERLGVSQPAISKLESGTVKNIGVVTLARYAAALGGRLRIELGIPKSRVGRRVVTTPPSTTLRAVPAKSRTSNTKAKAARTEARAVGAGRNRRG